MLPLLLSLVSPASALPPALRAALDPAQLPVLAVAPGDRKSAAADAGGGPVRFAVSRPLVRDLTAAARWQTLADGRRVGQVAVRAPSAASMSLAFSRAWLPPGVRLWLDNGDGTDARRRPLTAADGDPAAGPAGAPLWTPLVRGDELQLTIEVPATGPLPVLQLEAAKVGVRTIGAPPPQGSCNVDVVCPESSGWEAEIASVAVYSVGGEFWCSGVLLNNTRGDEDPLFATADHCGVGSSAARSLVVYWNYESPSCGRLSGGPLDDWQAGAAVLMSDSAADWNLLRLDDAPDPAFGVSWAGWDNGGAAPQTATAIHHPGTDEKAISFETAPTRITGDYEDREDTSETHIRVDDWDLGTTEGGSSGSPLFDENHRVAGVLTGGYAACGNDEPDWYGRLATAWDGSSASRRLRDWLDPDSTGQPTVDTHAPWMTGVHLRGTGLDAAGPEGGPFVPETATLSLDNADDEAHSLSVSNDVDWAVPAAATLTVGAGASETLTVALSSAAEALPVGRHTGTLTVSGPGLDAPATVPLALTVGTPARHFWWPLDRDPGFATEGDWAFGVPTGRGGSNGAPDPSSGATGDHVYGYNLDGDYDNNERARHLTTPALDFTGLWSPTLRFSRWLGVEEPAYDNADVQVSVDGGTTWTVVWANSAELDDGRWTDQELSLAGIADDQPDVRIRWTMGATDSSETWCGWNLDDIAIWAVSAAAPTPADTGSPEPEDTGRPAPDDSGTSPDRPAEDTAPPATDTAAAPATDPVSKDEAGATACGCQAGGLPMLLGGLPLVLVLIRRRETPDPEPR